MINKENRSKVYLVIIAILVVANISLLAFFLPKKETPKKEFSRPDRSAYIAAFLQKEVGFDAQQLKQYDTLSATHKEKMSSIFSKMKGNKGEQFRQLVAGGFTDSAINAVADKSRDAQKSAEIIMLTHMRNIRMICTPEQLPKFDSLFVKVLNRRGEGWRRSGNK